MVQLVRGAPGACGAQTLSPEALVMRHRTVIAILVSAFVVSVAWVGLRFEFENPVSRSPQDEPRAAVPQIAGPLEVSPTTPVEDAPGSSIPQSANGIALEEALAKDLAAELYTHFNYPFVQFLVNRGLSRQDGERVIGDAFHEAAICWFAAVRGQDEAEGRSFDPAFELERGALSNARSLNQLSASCINSALEQVGVNPPLGIKVNDA
jgi:hypothetical protein